jgi:hypothetical protein
MHNSLVLGGLQTADQGIGGESMKEEFATAGPNIDRWK